MLDYIIGFSIKNKLVIAVLVFALIVWGAWSAARLPIDAVPDITNNQVQIITSSPSLAAQEVERLITFPIETSMANIPGIEEVRSISRFGLSVVTVVFDDDIDVYWARQQVSERLKAATEQIPKGVGIPDLAPVTTGLGEIYQYTLKPKQGYEERYTPMELRSLQDWLVKRQLLGTKGVADVSSFGGYLKQYEIAVNPEQLRSMNISMSELFDALEANNQNTGGAYIDHRPNAWFIRTEGLVTDLDDIRKIVVKKTAAGIPITVGNVAKVQYGHAIRYGAMTQDGDGEVVGGIVMMLKGGNSNQVIQAVKERITQISQTLPEGVQIEAFLDRTKLVNNAIHTVSKNLIEGALIVIFVLVLMLGNVRAGLVVASVIPLAMLFALSMMNLFGVSGNLMSLGAIDFGLIVDGAVIIVEATMHHIAQGPLKRLSQQEMDEQVYQASSKIRNSAAFGEIIILIVYLPLLALVGIEGKMFKPMAQTVSFAILGAFILSLTYVPMMSAFFLDKKVSHRKTVSDKIMDVCARIYRPARETALRHIGATLTGALLTFILALYIFTRMGGEFIPTLDEGDLAIETRVLTGSSMQETVEASLKAGKLLKERFPEVKKVVGKIGASEIPTDPMPIEASDVMVILKDKKDWVSASTREELVSKMQEALEEIPGVSFGFQQPIQMRFNELMTGAKQDVAIKIYGEDLEVLSEEANRLGSLVSSVKGVEDLYIEQVVGLPQIVINYNRDQIAKFGISIEQINQVVNMAFAGAVTGAVYEGERRYDMVVRLDKDNRASIEDVQSLYVDTADGTRIPISQVADISFKMGPNQIQRDNTKRRITVAFNVRGADVESVIREIQQKVSSKIELPAGYYIVYGGQFKNLIEAKDRLMIAVPIALLLILVLLYFTFQSIKQSILIFSAIPLSAIGGVFALWVRGMPFSISAGVGFIALFGVAVLNGIVLISEFNASRKEGIENLYEIVRKGTDVRLRPVLMTAMVASLGFLPMALSHGAGAEVQKPLATVVIGGLISATLLTLLVLPVLYIIFEKGIKGGLRYVAAGVVCLIFLGIHKPVMAQPPERISLTQALQRAYVHNGDIKESEALISQQQHLRKSATEMPNFSAAWNYGQYNSYYNDNGITISQSIPFPLKMVRKQQYYDATIEQAGNEMEIRKNKIAYGIKSIYTQMAYLQARKTLLDKLYGMNQEFVQAVSRRLKLGEANTLELSTAEIQLSEIHLLQTQVEMQIQTCHRQLGTLIGATEPFEMTSSSQFQKLLLPVEDSLGIAQNPTLLYTRQQQVIAESAKKIEYASLLPDIELGYVAQTLRGTQNYRLPEIAGSGKRFQSVVFGLSFPLWFKPNLEKAKAISMAAKANEHAYYYIKSGIQASYKTQLDACKKYGEQLAYQEKMVLPSVKAIMNGAMKSYHEGAISYAELFQSLDKAMNAEMKYMDILNQYNQSVISIEFLLGIK